MKLTLKQLRQIIKDVVNEISPIGFGSLPPKDREPTDPNPIEDFEIKKAVFNHLKASGVIGVNEEPYGHQWNELEVWEVYPEDYGYADSVKVNGKYYYGEW